MESFRGEFKEFKFNTLVAASECLISSFLSPELKSLRIENKMHYHRGKFTIGHCSEGENSQPTLTLTASDLVVFVLILHVEFWDIRYQAYLPRESNYFRFWKKFACHLNDQKVAIGRAGVAEQLDRS